MFQLVAKDDDVDSQRIFDKICAFWFDRVLSVRPAGLVNGLIGA